jgi:glutamine amidotransferase
MGNLRSVAKALEAAGAAVSVTADPGEIDRADKLCVPGQGIFGRCTATLRSSGLADTVAQWIGDERPFLGICLGMQVLFGTSEEGDPPGLGILPGTVRRLPDSVRVPHIGWNQVNDEYFYFDHSYAVHAQDDSIVAGWCDHGERFAAQVEHAAVLGVQFHPEKSAAAGIALLERWIA